MQAISETTYWDNFNIHATVQDATITNQAIGNFLGKSLACKNIFIDILVVQVTQDSLMMY